MYALLGDIQFDLITYFDGMQAQFGADFAEHALIDGKPRLQYVGEKLDEFRIDLCFHIFYCDPEKELIKLQKAKKAHMAMSFVLGNGDYKGWFVLTEVQATSRATDKSGTLQSLDASITLREYVGDKLNPLPPPAVQPKLAPAAAQAKTIADAGGLSGVIGAVKSVQSTVRQVVAYANQAKSALKVVTDAVRVVQQLRTNPLAALSRVPGVLQGLGQAAGPLQAMAPALAEVSSQLPEVIGTIRNVTTAATAVRNSVNALSQCNISNVVGKIEYMAGQANVASNALQQSAPAISKLAAKVVTRSV